MKNEASKVKRSWDSSAEERAYKILSEKINLEYYQLNKHVALKDIFVSLKRKEKPQISKDIIWNINISIGALRKVPCTIIRHSNEIQ